MNSPRITVCVPVYNLEKYIFQTLESLQAQTFADYEAIIINDGSTDRSEDFIRPYLCDPRFKYVKQRNSGVSKARNIALDMAEGEWFAMLDGDDLWLPDKLAMQASMIEQYPDADLFYGKIVMFDDQGNEYDSYVEPGQPSGDIRKQLYESNFLPALTVLVKTELLRDINGFREQNLVEDYDAWLRLAQKGIQVRCCDKVIAKYRVRAGSNTSNVVPALGILLETLIRTMINEPDPELAGILQKRILSVLSLRCYETSRKAVKSDDRKHAAKEMWMSWWYSPFAVKKFAAASLLGIAAASGNRRMWDYLKNRLGSDKTAWDK